MKNKINIKDKIKAGKKSVEVRHKGMSRAQISAFYIALGKKIKHRRGRFSKPLVENSANPSLTRARKAR